MSTSSNPPETLAAVNRFGRNALSSVATHILKITVLVWVNQHLLRRIDPAEYSLFAVIMSLLIVLEMLRPILTGGIGRYLVVADARGDKQEVSRIVSSMFPLLLAAACCVIPLGIVAVWAIPSIIQVEPLYVADARLMLGLMLASFCLSLVTTPFSSGLYLRQRFTTINLITLMTECVRIVILLTLLLGVSTRVIWLVVATVTATQLNNVINILYTRRLVPAIRFRFRNFSLGTAKSVVQFGTWTVSGGVSEFVSKSLPVLILNKYGTGLDVANFHVGRLADEQQRSLLGAAIQPAQPALTSYYAKNDGTSLSDIYYRGGRYHLWISLALVAPLIVFGLPLIELYAGDRYRQAPLVWSILFARYPFIFASAMFYRVSHAIGQVSRFYSVQMLMQVATVGGLYFAVGVHGMGAAGAAMAIAISESSFHLFLIWWMGLRQVGGSTLRFLVRTVWNGLLPFASALVACYCLRALMPLDSWVRMGLACSLAFAVYTLVLLWFCLDATDRSLLKRLYHRGRTLFRPRSIIPVERETLNTR